MSPPAASHRFDLPSRKHALRGGIRPVLICAALIVLYAVVPVPRRSSAGTVVGLVVGALAFVALLSVQIRSIVSSRYPTLRAASSVAVAFTVLVVLFAYVYLSMSSGNSRTFSEPLDRVRGIYLSLTLFTTVGSGDIVPHNDTARVIVSIQYVADLLFIAVVGRVFLMVAQSARRERAQEATAEQ